jgi:hypothetical protein
LREECRKEFEKHIKIVAPDQAIKALVY